VGPENSGTITTNIPDYQINVSKSYTAKSYLTKDFMPPQVEAIMSEHIAALNLSNLSFELLKT
jgi:hypothetical protein